MLNSNSADDYAAANVGQLKYIATKAAEEFNSTLPVGAGDAIDSLITEWSNNQDGLHDDFVLLNQGQLKYVASLFYERLALYHLYENPIDGGSVPWTSSTNDDDDDYSAVNIGQLKYVFGFDTSSLSAGLDSDSDALPDSWELHHFGGLSRDGSGDWNEDGLLDRDAFRFGLNPKGDDESEVVGNFDTFSYDARGWLDGMTLTGNATASFGLDDEGNIETAQ